MPLRGSAGRRAIPDGHRRPAATALLAIDGSCSNGFGERGPLPAPAWDAGGRPETIALTIVPTLLSAHAEKELAAGTCNHGYRFRPLACWLDETAEEPAAILRPATAGSNTAADHFTALALAQLSAHQLRRRSWCARISASHAAFTSDRREATIISRLARSGPPPTLHTRLALSIAPITALRG